MFTCDECGKQRPDHFSVGQQIGSEAKICFNCANRITGEVTFIDSLEGSQRERLERREFVALNVLNASLSNPALTNPQVITTVAALVKTAFRVADEFISASETTFRDEEVKAGRSVAPS